MYETERAVRRWLAAAGVIGFVAAPALRSRPHPAYRALRSLEPIHRNTLGVWVLSGHAEVATALRHPALGSDEAKADLSALHLGPFRRRLAGSLSRPSSGGSPISESTPNDDAYQVRLLLHRLMLYRDPPDHTRLRSLVNKAFTPRAISSLEDRINQIAHEQIDQVERRREMDFLADFAYPLTAQVICEVMGVPADHHQFIARHAPVVAARLDPGPMRNRAVIAAAANATKELTGYLSEVIAARRAAPGDDILSNLLAVEQEGDRLSHDELVAMTVLLLIAGHETTANLLGNGVLALLTHREEWSRFKADPSLDQSTVEELLRFDGPIQMTSRVALDDVEISGSRIPKGRIVVLCVAAANRDPAVFDNPQRLDIGRNPNPHLGFGSGAHFCLGAPLARLETRLALRALAERLPDLRLTTSRHRWRPTFAIRGLQELPLAW